MTTEQQSFEKLAKAEATLVEKVAYPAFFEKVAAAGITPADQKVAQELLSLSDVVAPAVGRAVQRHLAAGATGQLNAVKAAADATRALAGLAQRAQPEASTAATFLEDADVKFAAQAVIAEQIKQANLANLMSMAPAKTPEEEEEEAKKKAPCA